MRIKLKGCKKCFVTSLLIACVFLIGINSVAEASGDNYTVTYDYNGATSSGVAQGNSAISKLVTYNGTYGTLPTPTKKHTYIISLNPCDGNKGTELTSTVQYTFDGWYLSETNNNGTGTKIISTSTVSTQGNHALYAAWSYPSNHSMVLPVPTRDGYKFDGWYQDISFTGEAITGSYQPTSNKNLYAKWSEVGFPITATSGANGSISFSGTSYVGIGRNKTYIFTANDGYQIDSVKVNGTKVETAGFYTFTNVNAAATIEVTFKAENITQSDKYILKKNIDNISLATKVKPGTVVTIEYVPQLGYTFDGWIINYGGIKIANSKDLIITFTMPQKPVEITANVSPSS